MGCDSLMLELAVDRGVPSSHVFMDHAGFSTYESLSWKTHSHRRDGDSTND